MRLSTMDPNCFVNSLFKCTEFPDQPSGLDSRVSNCISQLHDKGVKMASFDNKASLGNTLDDKVSSYTSSSPSFHPKVSFDNKADNKALDIKNFLDDKDSRTNIFNQAENEIFVSGVFRDEAEGKCLNEEKPIEFTATLKPNSLNRKRKSGDIGDFSILSLKLSQAPMLSAKGLAHLQNLYLLHGPSIPFADLPVKKQKVNESLDCAAKQVAQQLVAWRSSLSIVDDVDLMSDDAAMDRSSGYSVPVNTSYHIDPMNVRSEDIQLPTFNDPYPSHVF